MKSLFGLSMDTIMAWMLAVFLIVTAIVAVLALINPLFFKMGLRNIPRRRAQTTLIIVGLMLSTVIITSAFGTGDTISYSIRSAATTNLAAIDETVSYAVGTGFTGAAGGSTFIPASTLARISAALSTNKDVDGVLGTLVQSAPLQDLTSGQTKNRAALVGLPPAIPAAFGPLTTTGGDIVTMGQLGGDQVYINKRAADKLGAHSGDRLNVFVGNVPVSVHVRAIVRNESMAAGGLLSDGQQSDPTVLMPLDRVQRLIGQPHQVTTILVSNRGDAVAGAVYSDGVTAQLRSLLANNAQVARAQALLAAGAGKDALRRIIADPVNGGVKGKLTDLQTQLALPGQSAALKSLLSDPDVNGALKKIKSATVAGPLNDTLASISDYSVQPIKKQGLDLADLIGSVFTTIFVVFGLFSVAAGILLIFLIFVMLAAERRAEMGMARAVGTKRRHLIQQFLFEGYIYDLGAALIGVALGVGVGLGMVKIMASLFGAADFNLQSHVEPRSLVVAFCLGALVTFFTVAFSSYRVSRLNIVAAIRDLPETFGIKGGIGDAFKQPLVDLANVGRRLRRRRILGALRALLAAPWHFITAWRVFMGRGPLLLLVGSALLSLGVSGKSEFLYTMGISLLLIGGAMLLRWIMAGLRVREEIRNRIGFSLAGILLVIYWLLPFDALTQFGVPNYGGGIEMFFISGIMLVIGGVWTVMYNSDLILGALMAVFGSRGSLAPILKTAVTYPMQYKFRTGLTLAMFSLVIFTLMVMSVLTRSTASTLDLNRDTGGYDIYGAINRNNPIRDIQSSVAHNPRLPGIAAAGGIARTDAGARQPGQADQSWQPETANLLDPGYLASTGYTLHNRAEGFASDAQVWRTLRSTPGYAVVDDTLIGRKNGGGFGGNGFTISGFHYNDIHFKAPRIEVRDTRTGTVMRLTVIGVLDQGAENLQDLTPGIYTGMNSLAAAGGPQVLANTLVVRVTPGTDVHRTALALGRQFLRNGLDVKETRKEFATNQAINDGLNSLLQAFMGLGLVVGIAALGVIAFRSVVERRQQIGMMRAIGFQRSMVRNSFLLESSFVAILGTGLGVVLGLVLARNLVDSIARDNPGVVLSVPWVQIGLIVVIAYVASLLTTYIPAWQASRVDPADALRYE